MHTPQSHSESALTRLAKGKLAAAAFGVIGALGIGAREAKAEVHKGIMAVVGNTAPNIQGTIQAHMLDLDYNAANPAASKVTSTLAASKTFSSTDKVPSSGIYNAFSVGRNLLSKEFATAYGGKKGLHVYWDSGNGGEKSQADLLLDASNIEAYDAKDDYYLSEGTAADKDQIIATYAGSAFIKTYNIVKDEAGRITGLKLVAKTDFSDNPSMLDSDERRVRGDYMATTRSFDEQSVMLLKKDGDGTWKMVGEKKMTSNIFPWSKIDYHVLTGAPDASIGIHINTADDPLLFDHKLDLAEKGDTSDHMSFGGNFEYRIYLDGTSKKYVVKNAKGEIAELKGFDNLPKGISLWNDFVKLSGTSDTYVSVGVTVATFIKITSTSPFKAEATQISYDLPKMDKSVFVPGRDTDQDRVYDFTDNCVKVANPNQADGDKNSIGDACDPNLWDMSWKKLPGVNAQLGCDDAASEPAVKPITGGVELDFTGSGKIGLQPAGVSNESGNIQIRVAAGCSITIETSEGTVTKDGKAVSGKTTCASDTIFKVSPFATVKVIVVAGTAVTPDANPGSDATSGEDAKKEEDAGSAQPETSAGAETSEKDAGSTDTGNAGADAGSAADTGNTPKADAAQQADTNGPSIGTPKAPPEGCNASPRSPMSAAEGILRITIPIAGLIALRAGLRRREEENVVNK